MHKTNPITVTVRSKNKFCYLTITCYKDQQKTHAVDSNAKSLAFFTKKLDGTNSVAYYIFILFV